LAATASSIYRSPRRCREFVELCPHIRGFALVGEVSREAMKPAPRLEASHVRLHLSVEGIVQGVGFRPFVHALAMRLGLAGTVANNSHGVTIEIEGDARAVDEFVVRLKDEAPPLAAIEHVAARRLAPQGAAAFTIAASDSAGSRQTLISPDVATCEDCLRELFDPRDRRYLYPFINCTNCGPRFTIIRDIPYDRPLTTMAGFAMCDECAREYHDPANRRFHAQPICCARCGPRLTLADRAGSPRTGDPIRCAAELIATGHIVAVKGLGGYHLAAAAEDEPAVSGLRARKHRADKPFAVMVPDLAWAGRLGLLEAADARLLQSPHRPIVMVRRRPFAPLATSVAPANRFIGLMLPYTPLHHLLCHHLNAPFVLTSGNVSDEPIAYRDEEAFARLAPIADFFLAHDRPIHVRVDDSVTRTFRGVPILVRRARGYAPRPIRLPRPAARPVLACGAELKATFCLVRGSYALVSQHIGDLENFETLTSFTGGIAQMTRMFGIMPAVVAHDLHPEYLSTKYARELRGVELLGIQHHHAHLAACLADNGEIGPAIGVAFDGLGYGTDGTLWGGEFMIADLTGFTRAAHLQAIAMPGGVSAIRQPWRMAAAYLDSAYGSSPPTDCALMKRHRRDWDKVIAVARNASFGPRTSSAGRLFDAVAAIVGIRDAISYEGQAAVELEQCADPREKTAYPVRITAGAPLVLHGADLVRAATEETRAGIPPALVAARFHNGLAEAVRRVCRELRRQSGLALVALSGGVFQNELLLTRCTSLLEEDGFRVLIHHQVPANDGGISFGQAAIAAARGH
jgi:hydrogenase maturation protein HypF